MSHAGARVASFSAWALCALAISLYAATLVGGVRHGMHELADGPLWMGAFLAFAFVGTLLASKRPRAWMPGAAVLLVWIPLTFPTGRPPTPRWRWVGWLGALGAGLLVVPATVAFAPRAELLLLEWEDAIAALGAPLLLRIGDLGFPLLPLAGGLAITSLIVRYVRARGDERHQLKWFAYAAVLTLGFVVVTNTLSPPEWLDRTLGALAVPSVAIAIAIAVLRYRLYEIDRIISRTVAYALLTGVLAVVYLGATFALQLLLRPVTGDSQLAVAGATLAVAALFQPARRRIQATVDRRFNRARYDAQRIVQRFRARLRDEVDLDQLRTELVGAVRSTVEPARVSLWLRARDVGTRS